MTKAAEKILAEAMCLEPDERLALAETLLEHAPHTSDPAYLAAWGSEIQRRLTEYETGDVQRRPLEEVRKRLMDDRRNAS